MLQMLNGDQLVALADALFKKHLVQPMGRFKGFCGYVKRERLRPVRTMRKDGVLGTKLIKNWNCKTDGEREIDNALRKLSREMGYDRLGPPRTNVVVSVLQPSFAFGNSCMPALLVQNYTEAFMKLHGGKFGVVAALKKAYGEGLGRAVGGARASSEPYNVHYRSITSEKDKPPTHDLELCSVDPPH